MSAHDRDEARAERVPERQEPIGEVIIGEEGFTKGWTVIKWRADLPPIPVGMKLYAAPQPAPEPAERKLLTKDQIINLTQAVGKTGATRVHELGGDTLTIFKDDELFEFVERAIGAKERV